MMPLDAWSIYLPITLVPILPLILVAMSHALPSRLTSLAPESRAGPLGISLICVEIVRSGKVLLSQQVLLGVTSVDLSTRIRIMCEVDTVLTVYLLTALVAHLPIITFSMLKSQATPSHPTSIPPRAVYLLPLIYTYALIPIMPILADAGMEGFGSQWAQGTAGTGALGGFGEWWGVHCRERGEWWRIARPATVAPPLILTIPLLLALFASIYANVGISSPSQRFSRRTILAGAAMLLAALGGIAYLVLEQVRGWSEDWWPRIFESIPAYIVVAVYASYSGVWRSYSHWIRFSRPPPATDIGEPSNIFALPPLPPKRPTSSFYAPSTPPRTYTSPSQVDELDIWTSASREEKRIPALKMRYLASSVYSVDSLQPLSPLSQYSKVTYPSKTMHRAQAPSAIPSAWHGPNSALVNSNARLSHNTLRSLFGLVRPTTRERETDRSSSGPPPFTWSVSVSEPETVLPSYVAYPAPIGGNGPAVRSDDASSISRYSLPSISPPVKGIQSDSHMVFGGLPEMGRLGRYEGRKPGEAGWIYPPEVFQAVSSPRNLTPQGRGGYGICKI